MASIDFQRGRLDTRFVERYLAQGRMPEPDREEYAQVAAMVGALIAERKKAAGSAANVGAHGRALLPDGRTTEESNNWRLAGRKAGLR